MNIELLKIIEDMKHNSLNNYIVPGLVSSLVGGGEYGKVRLFQTDRITREFITPHSHRFDFVCMVLEGRVYNTVFTLTDEDKEEGELWCRSSITQVCGSDGLLDTVHVREDKPTRWKGKMDHYEKGDIYHMNFKEIHSICFGKKTTVLFFEGPQKSSRSSMIEPWANGKVIPTFKTEDWMFEKLEKGEIFS